MCSGPPSAGPCGLELLRMLYSDSAGSPPRELRGHPVELPERFGPDGVNDRQGERLDRIDAAGQHLLDIIHDVLSLSQIEAGRMNLEAKPLDLAALCRGVLEVMADEAHRKGLALCHEFGDLPPILLGDAVRLRQSLLNYLGNAVKFTESGSIRPRSCQADSWRHVSSSTQ